MNFNWARTSTHVDEQLLINVSIDLFTYLSISGMKGLKILKFNLDRENMYSNFNLTEV